jgi:beta-D-xylosidase 4
MVVKPSFLLWSLALTGVSTTVAAPSPRSQQRQCVPANAAASYTASISFLGCYTDNAARVLQGGEGTTPGGATPQVCADTCGNAGFAYAGVEYST